MPLLASKAKHQSTKTSLPRPPVVTVMGHIDHGKTTLLDALRNTHLQSQETGGITQHIGAYQVNHQGQSITFIDTPGHAAFAAMRSRGVQATDLVVLVIDSVESVKPQTKECLEHIKIAAVPFLVAINKMDLPNATPAVVKKDLADAGVLVEGYGGDIVTVEISAKQKQNLDQLLDMILLLAQMQSLTSKPQALLKAVVIESFLDQKKGPVATVIVKQGQLREGDAIYAGTTQGKIKALYNYQGQNLNLVLPGEPAQILGFKQAPPVGSVVSHTLQTTPADRLKTIKTTDSQNHQPTLAVILKADATGTLEAIAQNLTEDITLVSQGIGEINESDVLLAQSTGARIIAFRVPITKAAEKLSQIESIFIKSYTLIHELLDDLQQQVLKLLEPTIDETILGGAKVLQIFTVKNGQVAGCEITNGKFQQGDKIHLLRNKQVLFDAKIKSIQIGKDSVDKAKKGDQCGISFTTDLDFKPKDQLQAFKKL